MKLAPGIAIMKSIWKFQVKVVKSVSIPRCQDVKNLELWILISWDGAMVDYFDLNFSNALRQNSQH